MGFGRIGKALAKRCLGFDMEIFVHDPFINENEITSNNCIPINKDEALIEYTLFSKDLLPHEEYENAILDDYLNNKANGDKMSLYNYLMEHRCNLLLEEIEDF